MISEAARGRGGGGGQNRWLYCRSLLPCPQPNLELLVLGWLTMCWSIVRWRYTVCNRPLSTASLGLRCNHII